MLKLAVLGVLVFTSACGVDVPEAEAEAAKSPGIVAPPPTCAQVASGRISRTRKLMPAASGVQFGSGVFQTLSGIGPTGNWLPKQSGDALIASLPVEAGERLEEVDVSVLGDPQTTIGVEIVRSDTAFSTGLQIGLNFDMQAKTTQTVAVTPFTMENIDTSISAYWLKIVAQRADGASADNQSIIGPAVVRTTVAAPTTTAPSC